MGSNGTCPACEGGISQPLLHVVTREVPAHERLIYHHCSRCGLVFLPGVTENRLDAHYVDPYVDFTEDEFAVDAQFRIERNRYRKHWLDRKLAALGLAIPQRDALEVGTKDGSFLWLLKQDGWEVMGVDPNVRFGQLARRHYGVNIVTDYFNPTLFPERRFGVIAAFQVLEHFAHPKPFLQAVARVLHPQGLLYLETPTLTFMEQRQLQRGHVMQFSPRTLTQLLEQSGFRVLVQEECGPGVMTFDQLVILAQPADIPTRPGWMLQDDFETAKRLLERAISDEFPNPTPALRNRAFRVACRVLGTRTAEALKQRYLAIQARRGARQLARLDAQGGPASMASVPALVREALMQGWVGRDHLLELARLSDELAQLKVLARIKAYRLSVEATRQLVNEEQDRGVSCAEQRP